MKTTRNEALKLDYGIPASTTLIFVLARADELERAMDAAAVAAGDLALAIGDGEAARRLAEAAGAVAGAREAVEGFAAFLDESGLRSAGERM